MGNVSKATAASRVPHDRIRRVQATNTANDRAVRKICGPVLVGKSAAKLARAGGRKFTNGFSL